MATRFKTLAWKIPWTEETGGLQSMRSQRVRHDWAPTHIHASIFNSTQVSGRAGAQKESGKRGGDGWDRPPSSMGREFGASSGRRMVLPAANLKQFGRCPPSPQPWLRTQPCGAYVWMISSLLSWPEFGTLGIKCIFITWMSAFKYWVSRKVHLGFSTRCYGMNPDKFLVNSVLPFFPLYCDKTYTVVSLPFKPFLNIQFRAFIGHSWSGCNHASKTFSLSQTETPYSVLLAFHPGLPCSRLIVILGFGNKSVTFWIL